MPPVSRVCQYYTRLHLAFLSLRGHVFSPVIKCPIVPYISFVRIVHYVYSHVVYCVYIPTYYLPLCVFQHYPLSQSSISFRYRMYGLTNVYMKHRTVALMLFSAHFPRTVFCISIRTSAAAARIPSFRYPFSPHTI